MTMKKTKDDSHYQQLVERFSELQAELEEAQERVEVLQEHCRGLENRLEAILNSTTWKIFFPIRLMVLLAKRCTLFLKPRNYINAYKILRQRGFEECVHAIKLQLFPNLDLEQSENRTQYHAWIKKYDSLTQEDKERITKHINIFNNKPLISVVMPVYNVEEKWLRQAIDSVLLQLYPHWELCIADDCSSAAHIKKTLDEYAAKDDRITVVYRKTNGHISASSNSALELASGEFVALMDHDDIIPEHALYMVANEINAHPDVDMIYSDEDKIDTNNERYGHYFKSDWNLDLFYSQNMFSHLGVYRTSLLQEIGGFREGYEGSQDYDLALRCLLHTDRVRHIPYILYHWRAIEGSTSLTVDNKDFAVDAATRALQDYFKQKHEHVEIVEGINSTFRRVKWPLPKKLPKVSIIIPTRNAYDLLKVTISSVLEKTQYDNYEIIIVNNQSDEKEVLEYFKELKNTDKVTVLDYDQPFNYSAINNFAVKKSHGELLAFVNNDIEVITPEWLNEMVSHALRPEIGAVGAKLYYPDHTIQHAGVFTGFGEAVEPVAGHAFHSLPRNGCGYRGRAIITQQLSGVTAACLVVRKNIFDEIGGFNEKDLSVAFNDVDLCLRITEKGYKNLFTPYAELYHYESATRGKDDTSEKKTRFRNEVSYMRQRWKGKLDTDPYFNPNLQQVCGNFLVRFPPKIKKPWLKANP